MKGQILIVFAVVAVASALSFFNKMESDFVNEVTAAQNQIVRGLFDVFSRQCDNIRKGFGVSPEQMAEPSRTPDVSKLNVVLDSPEYKQQIALSALAKTLLTVSGYPKSFRIFIHGFTDDPTKKNFQSVNDAFHANGYHHLLALDASSLIKWEYLQSTAMIPIIGGLVGSAMVDMYKNGIDTQDIYCIGHSLGAQICGFAGKKFTNETGEKIGRITGLDPAGPCFKFEDDDARLKKTDAKFVDVIHCDASVFGISEIVGHADFWPNLGGRQPGCLIDTCSHSRCVELYVESLIDPKAFPAVNCPNHDEFTKGNCSNTISYMGINAARNQTGNFYLQTKESSPYGAYETGTKYVDNTAVIDKALNKLSVFLN